jgi:hypothetical protein
MARDSRKSEVLGNRSAHDLRDRRRTAREVELTIRDGMKILRLVFRGVVLVVRYHEGGETEGAFEALRVGARSLAEAAGRLGLSDRATAELVLDPIAGEVGLMYDALTADRLTQALRQSLGRPELRGSR